MKIIIVFLILLVVTQRNLCAQAYGVSEVPTYFNAGDGTGMSFSRVATGYDARAWGDSAGTKGFRLRVWEYTLATGALGTLLVDGTNTGTTVWVYAPTTVNPTTSHVFILMEQWPNTARTGTVNIRYNFVVSMADLVKAVDLAHGVPLDEEPVPITGEITSMPEVEVGDISVTSGPDLEWQIYIFLGGFCFMLPFSFWRYWKRTLRDVT